MKQMMDRRKPSRIAEEKRLSDYEGEDRVTQGNYCRQLPYITWCHTDGNLTF